MDDRKKQIAESIADACVRCFIESYAHSFPGSTISNLKVRVGPVRPTLIGDERSESYKPNPRRSKLEDGLKPPPYVLTKEFAGEEPRQPGKPRKDVGSERQNRFALWREALRNLWPDLCW